MTRSLGGETASSAFFDMDGNFVRRFATAGLERPLGITQASANFGPLSNFILIGNAGDGNNQRV